ncbi:MAG: hypothetical protein VX210_15430 [Myxococcota bacterium]|nr:hypothetical protein [Myxococcota bacterium]
MQFQKTKYIHRKSYLIPLSLTLFLIVPKLLPELKTMLDEQIGVVPFIVYWSLTKVLHLLKAGGLVSPVLFVIGWRRNRRWKREGYILTAEGLQSQIQSS